MIDTVYIPISAYNLQKLFRLHDYWRAEKGSVMAEQDINYILGRLLDRYLSQGKIILD